MSTDWHYSFLYFLRTDFPLPTWSLPPDWEARALAYLTPSALRNLGGMTTHEEVGRVAVVRCARCV